MTDEDYLAYLPQSHELLHCEITYLPDSDLRSRFGFATNRATPGRVCLDRE